jgi:hypothetical protein
MSQKLSECFKCKSAGFPGVQIFFAGKQGDQWIMKNPDGSEHKHKTKAETKPVEPSPALSPEQQRQADIQKAHIENMQANRELVAAINNLAAAIREVRK